MRKLHLENLEARALLAGDIFSDADHYINNNPGLVNSPTNTAPVIINPITIVGGNEILGRTASVSILANDNRPESNLRYYWSVVRAPEFPEDATIVFSSNGTNAAKNNRMTFTTHGEYEIMVTVVDAKGLTASSNLTFNVARNISRVTVTSQETGPMVFGTQRQYVATAYDQFGNVVEGVTPRWTVNTSSAGTVVDGLYTVGTRAGTFSVRATYNRPGGSITGSASVNVVAPILTTISLTPSNTTLQGGDSQQYSVVAYDQLGNLMPNVSVSWSATGGTINNGLYVAGQEAGEFIVTATVTHNGVSLSQSSNVTIEAQAQILTTVVLTPANSSIKTGETLQYNAIAYDQNGNVLNDVILEWSATGGTINNGLYTGGNIVGDYVVSVKASREGVEITQSTGVRIDWPDNKPTFLDQALGELVDSYYMDLFLSREEMIAILRSTGDETRIDANELSDVRMIVTTTWYVMPDHVRALAKNVVSNNNANLRYKGQTAGNLVDGSSETLLNNLIDKWFLGTDVPVAASNLTYISANGSVFNGPLTLNQSRQGYIGDCYFLASIVSIAGKNPEKIMGMFIDNGDDTWTIRWFKRDATGAAAPTYVTVNRMLPTSGGNLQYAGLGQSAINGTAVLWGALLEKAYAQWNETGEAGRNGTNTYSGIEGGWMHNVNFQSLGYNSTNYSFSSSTETTFRNEILAGKAVTVGTRSSVGAGWVAGHAYIVTINANGLYDLTNPWGYNHRLGVTWNEIVANCTIFTTTFVS